MSEMFEKLRLPFHPSMISFKPGAVKGDRALAMAYADLRAYMHRLDEVCGDAWEVNYEPWGQDRIICRLTINGVTRSSTGESDKDSEKSEIGGTSAEAQAFKRASAMFGLGRYLYNLPTGWAEYDPARRQFTDKAKARLVAMLVQHYRRATDAKTELSELYVTEQEQGEHLDGDNVTPSPEMTALLIEFDALGRELYNDQWTQVCGRNVKRISGGKAQYSNELTEDQIQQLITGMTKLKIGRRPITAPVATSTAPSVQPSPSVPVESDGSAPAYAALIDKLTGDCLERANRARKIHAQSKGPSSPEQYRFLAGTIDDLVKTMGGHKAVLEVFAGRAVTSANPPGIQLASKLLDALLEERTVERDGEKVKEANPDYNPDAVRCVHGIWALVLEQNGQASLFEPTAQEAQSANGTQKQPA